VILIDNRNTSNPYLNLAIEEFLIRNLEVGDEDYLFLYINSPCIVLGKNQSIYKEVNFEYLRNGQLKLARRITGGGTVYHDEGNLNFSIISKFEESKINNYKYFNQPVIDALGRVGVEAGMDGRNNIICNGKKISGSAQFTNRKNIISHGTLLFNANLDVLRLCLKANDFKLETRAVSSVNSSVMNLNEVTNRFKAIHNLQDFLVRQLNVSSIYQFNDRDWTAVEKLAEDKFKSFAWVYGRSPFTKIEKNDLVIEVEDGMIVSITGNGPNFSALKGIPYQYQSIKKALENFPNADDLLTNVF
jgi:lipoate-protein ligase A